MQLDPPQRRQRTLDALKRVLLRESQEQPLLLVFEDLHWIDSETQALLHSLVESLPSARLLLLVNYRPEYQHGWGSKTYYTQLRLDPLPAVSADEFLQALLGDDVGATGRSPLQALKQMLIARTEGNPFFLDLSTHFYIMSVHDQGIAFAQRALALATAGGDVVLPALANLHLCRAYHAQGDYRLAIDCLRQTAASFEGVRRRERFGHVFLPAVNSRAHLAWCYAYHGIGLLALRQGDLPRALPLLEHAVGICQEADLPTYFSRMAATLGAAYTLAGRVADAVPLLTQAMEQAIEMERVADQALCRLVLGEAQQLTGHLEEAYALAEHALALAREQQERGHQAYALRLLGDIAALRDPPEGEPAVAHCQQALALADELGMRPLQAHCRRGLGTLYAKRGQWEQARTELCAARDLYQAMEMTFRLPQAEATLVQVGGV